MIPLTSISWWARGAGRAVGPAGRVSARGAELRLWPAAGPDAGHYSCSVTAPGGAAAKRDIEIQVRNPPKISPFIFSSELTEGSAVQVLCGVSSGDKPMYFSWLKDGAPLPSNLQIEEKSLNEFSLLMFSDLTARHSGDYTCRVSNHAATVNYTATLSVKVAPVWVTEPLDTAVLLGAPLHLECAAKGYPIPSVAWYRRIELQKELMLENIDVMLIISMEEAPPQDSWNGELLGYVASWRELSRFEEEAAGEDGERSGSATSPGWSSAEMTLGGLRSFARYAVAVRAYNRAGAGPPSTLVYATTADGVPEAPPTSVFCEAVSARAVRVRWAPPPGAQHAHSLRGYELHYAPLHLSPSWSGAGGGMVARAGAGAAGEATLQGLRAAANYSVTVRARADRGLGPPSPPVYCATREDVPGAVEAIRALAASADAVRVSWLPPSQRAGRLTHYTLYTRELGKVGGEWSQRVEAGEAADEAEAEAEVWREVVGLRERTVYEFWVRASTAAGAGPPTRLVTAAPTQHLPVRISSFGRVVFASWGSRVRLRCAAVGPAPLRWRWSPAPMPPAHTVTDDGDLIIHKAEANANFTCSVRSGGGGDAAQFALVVRTPPAAPAPRLVRADTHALHLAWDPPPDTGTPLLGYTVWWSRGSSASGAARSARVAGGESALWLRGLACGALYRVTVRAHNAVGASPHSRPLLARTRGDKAKAPPGKEFVWANSTALRLNLLAWGGRCPVAAWTVALRPTNSAPAAWLDLIADGESALAINLRPGTWYEIRVVARSPAGDTPALYRAATHTINGERIGEPMELPIEARSQLADGAAEVVPDWRSSLAPLLLGGGLAALLASLAVGLVLARRRALCVRRECSLHEARAPHPQLYTTEPGKRNGKTLTPPDGELHEISPYATFSMAGGACAERGGCALHLRTFGRAEELDLAAPPPRPNLLAHANEYGRARDSDSESSGSPCAACAAELYRLPAAHIADTLPAVESSAEDTSYSAGAGTRASSGRGSAVPRADRADRADRGARQPRGRRRRDHARHASGPTVRYFAAGAARQEAL
ncbi:hypothetical protein ABMA28_006630 [Loxostege sticticalis]|uniref:Down syndrome cell adhesion molecule-like protein Dscam2 n=1 Tax=Loxostege sticticalis TaxID=481309 RepID=A0ABD0TN16_LOXSC